jgi:predicted Zn-dependent protease
MALAAVGDRGAVDACLRSCRAFADSGPSTEATVMRDVGLPMARAVLSHRQGDYDGVVAAMMPIRSHIRRIGASHAQRDLFDQLLIDGAWRAGQLDVAADLLAERTRQRPGNRWGWKHYAAVLTASRAPGAREAAATLDRLRHQ